jgi:hypothetical protein
MDVHLSSARMIGQISLIFDIQEFFSPRFVPIEFEHSSSKNRETFEMGPKAQNSNFSQKQLQ